METVKIYLSGAMSSLSYEEQYGWRSQIANAIKFGNYDCSKNPVFFNPVDYYNFTEVKHRSENEVMEFDLNALRSSDLVVVNFNDPNSLGTCAELAIAHELRIPIVGINEGSKELHPWLDCFCGRMCSDVEEAIDYIVEFYLN